MIYVTSKGSNVRVAGMIKVRVKERARARKNPAVQFTPVFAQSWDFSPSKKVELHREDLYIQLLEWYGLYHLKTRRIISCV